MNKSAFVAALEDAEQTIKGTRPRAEEGAKRPYVFHGIGLLQRNKSAAGSKVVPLLSSSEKAA